MYIYRNIFIFCTQFRGGGQYKRKRDLLAEALEAAGIIPMRGEGGFFLIGDTRNLKVDSHTMWH